MSIFKRALRVFSEEGAIPLIQKAIRYTLSRTISDSTYRLFLPEKISLQIRENIVYFDSDIASLGYDFRDDFNSEKEIITEFMSDLEHNDVVYDIGANVGLYSTFAGTIVDNGKIIAFEPHPAAVPVLYRNLRTNCRESEVIQIAVSNRAGFERMAASASTAAKINSEDGIHVPLKKLSSIIETGGFGQPDVIKIDVEGAEREVLSGIGSWLPEIDLLYVEIHHQKVDEFGAKEFDIEKNLKKEFDEVLQLGTQTRGTTVTHIKATNRNVG
jgi:FkbM family methyltransferase